MVTDPLRDRVRVLGHHGMTWTVREMEPLPNELALDQSWFVFTPNRGTQHRIPMLRSSLALLSPEDLARLLDEPTAFSELGGRRS